jgi:hypothetical protein
MNIILDTLFDLHYSFKKKPEPTLLAIAVERFTNSTWLEDLCHFKTLDMYIDKGKGSYLDEQPKNSHCEQQALEMVEPN